MIKIHFTNMTFLQKTRSSIPMWSNLFIKKIIVTSIVLTSAMGTIMAQNNAENFVDALMQKMTLAEKIGQLNLAAVPGGAITGNQLSKDINNKIIAGEMGGVFGIWNLAEIKQLQDKAVKQSRLGIPLLFGLDVIHGHQTIFPVPLAMSCSWDTALLKKVAQVSAVEASAQGINWVFSPMVDITRDARWGRVVEGSGEDPFLGAAIAEAMVKGYQGNDLTKANTVMACVKHFALYGAAEAGKEYNTVDMSLHRMYQDYLPPYRAAIEAGAGSLMTSFNDINGLPSTGNKWLLTDLLRKQWGFKGLVVSDYGSVSELSTHGLGDAQQVAALAINAGTDMEMVGEYYLNTLQKSLKEGKVTIQTINNACRLVLLAKYKLGLFQNPYLYINFKREKKEVLSPSHLKLAREVAAKSFVLLKNEHQLLPLNTKKRIALIGPLANSKINMLGAWSIAGDYHKATTVLEGLQNAVGNRATIFYQKGANITDDSLLKRRVNSFKPEITTDKRTPQQMIDDALKAASKADVIVAALGEAADMSGESASRAYINIPQSQQKLLKALYKTGKPIVLVLFNGRPLAINWAEKHCNAILDVWFGGLEAGNAVADVLFGKYNPSGKLTMTFPRSVGQVPIYYSHKRTGRPYNDFSNESAKYKSDYLDQLNVPLYPFGFGLSYTKFSYGKLQLSKTNLVGNETLKASIRVTNEGKFAGAETVQLYITDPVAKVTRSVKDLKGFKKIQLNPGESKTVHFDISTDMLKYFDYHLHYNWDAGQFIIQVGTNSRDTQKATINWVK